MEKTSPGDNDECKHGNMNIYSTPSIKSMDFNKTEVEDKINELNLITESDYSEKGNDDDTENLNEILLSTVNKDYQKVKGDNNIMTSSNKPDRKTSQELKKISEFEVINQDPYLKPYEGRIKERVEKFKQVIKDIETNEGDFYEFCRGYKKMGLQITQDGVKFTEYAPGARALSIVIFY
jgi:hypothetical protein